MSDGLFVFNGINVATGKYAMPPLTNDSLTGFLAGDLSKAHLDALVEGKLAELQWRSDQLAGRMLGVVDGIEPEKIAEAGWAAILPHDSDPAIKASLRPLLDLRKQQAGNLFRVYDGSAGYLYDAANGDFQDKDDWLAGDARRATPGDADPERCPYYLLIVGGPDQIPFQFQYDLGVNYAVGRIHFDSAAEYGRYAQSVVAYETGAAVSNRKATFFSVRNPDDVATELSSTQLVPPLEAALKAEFQNWDWRTVGGAEARRDRLVQILAGSDAPSLLFTSSHGLAFPMDDPRQRERQGALLCADWPGPDNWDEAIPDSFYFSGNDLPPSADLTGTIVFIFACYGAGTPKYDNFHQQAFHENKLLTNSPFIARLPQKMLSNPGGAALGAVAHVERAWTYSFSWPDVGEDFKTFDSVLSKIVKGKPLGFAMEHFSGKFASLMTSLNSTKDKIRLGDTSAKAKLTRYWTSTYDARNYILLGDPAVRLKT